jgi:F-type H+-transporting ATPase subunit epsilon
MADKVQFELVTPARLVLAEEADMVVVPGGAGDFGVLPGHAPLMSTLRPGTIDIYQGNQVTRRLFVESGFTEVADDRCTVLAEEAIPTTEIDREAAEARLTTARAALDAAPDEGKVAAQKELAAAEARVAAAQGAAH